MVGYTAVGTFIVPAFLLFLLQKKQPLHRAYSELASVPGPDIRFTTGQQLLTPEPVLSFTFKRS